MDRVKEAFAETIQDLVQRQVLSSGLPKVEEQYTVSISIEVVRASPLITRVHINQGPHLGTRYFDVVVKEHFK